MALSDFLANLLAGVVKAEAPKLLSLAETKLPGTVDAFINFALSTGKVQDLENKLFSEGVSEVQHLFDKGLAWVENEIKNHVHGQLGAFLVQDIEKLRTAASFTTEQANEFAALIMLGRWDAVKAQFLKDVGL